MRKFQARFRDGPLAGQVRTVDGLPITVRDERRVDDSGWYEGRYELDDRGEYRWQGFNYFRLLP